jgi:heme A synthase
MMRYMNPRLHRYALLLAIFALAVIVSGAIITSTEVAARQSQAQIPGGGVDQVVHKALAIALTLLTLGIAIWTSVVPTPRSSQTVWLRAVAWTGVATLAIDAALGWAPPPLSPGAGVLHALLAHLFFSLMVVIALGTSPGWNREPELVDGSSRPLLRPCAVATPPVVFLQITLGATYRHDMTSVMPHMAVAMGVAFLALIVSSVVLQNFPRPASLRRAAAALITIVLTQVCLGITAFVLLVLNMSGTLAFVLATVGHVTVGAATLAASVVMAMQVWRSVSPRAVVSPSS